MIEPLEGAERYRVQDVAAKLNEVIALVNGLLGDGVEAEIVGPTVFHRDGLAVVHLTAGRLRLRPGGTP